MFLLLLPCTLSAAEPPRPTAQQLVDEGVRLHDEGRYDDAIERYKQALAIEPDSSLVLYEMATTYLAAKRYDLCEEVGRKGLKKPGDFEGPLYAIVASCLSSAGKSQEALGVFEDALKKHPDDTMLNFNIAITLIHLGKTPKAVEHLQKAIRAQPSYATPYYVLGLLAADAQDATSGIFYMLRFVSLNPDEPRVGQASAKIFDLLTQGVVSKNGGDIDVTLNPGIVGQDDRELAILDLSRTLAAATIYLEDAKPQSKAERYVGALTSFLTMSGEMSQGADSAGLRKTFVWENAVAPVLALGGRGVLECLGYFLADQAGFEGAGQWLGKNPGKRQELQAAFAELKN